MNALLSGAPDLALRATVLILGAWFAAALLAKAGASAATRNLVWTLGIGALLLLPILFALLPGLPLLPDLGGQEIVTGLAPATAAPAEAPRIGLAPILYLAVAALLVGRLALARLALARLWARSAPLGPEWDALAAELGASYGLSRPATLRRGAGPVMPMTWGLWRARVLLPADASGWTPARRRSVLAHELAHVARRDSLALLAASLAGALYWFHPGIWFALRRMRIEQEHACDDLVLAGGASPRLYARDLLDVAFALRAPALAGSGSLAMARRSQLERRLVAIVAARSRRRPGRASAFGLAAGALLTTILAAAAVPARADREAALPAAPAAAAIAAVPLSPPAPPAPAARPRRPLAPIAARAPAPPAPPSPPPPLQALSAAPPVPPVPMVPTVPPVPPVPTVPPSPASPPSPPSPPEPPG